MTERQIAFDSPIYCMTNYTCPSFLGRETSLIFRKDSILGKSPQIVLCGGGGASKSGIANYVTVGGIKRSADNKLHFKSLVMHNTNQDLVHRIVSASNGRFLFGCLRNGTVIYRVIRGEDDSHIKLEQVLFKETDSAKHPMQNTLVVKSDDTSILTGGEDGTFHFWIFRKKEGSEECELHSENQVNLFSCSIEAAVLNPTQNYCIVGSGKGELAVIDLSSFGIVQRVAAPFERCRVASVLFGSATMLFVLYNINRDYSSVQLFTPEKDRDEIKWKKDREMIFKKRVICCMQYISERSVLLLGTNNGEVGAITIPSFHYSMKFQRLHELPVTSVIHIPATSCLLTMEQRLKYGDEYKKEVNRAIEDEGWVVSSSVDYTVAVQRFNGNALIQYWDVFVFILFLFLVVFVGLRIL